MLAQTLLGSSDVTSWIMEFRTDNNGDAIYLPFPETSFDTIGNEVPEQAYQYNFTIDWGDGSALETVTTFGTASHIYSTAGDYDVKINGLCEAFMLTDGSSYELIDIKQWGNAKFVYHGLSYCFYSCFRSQMTAIDAPDVSELITLIYTFSGFAEGISYDITWDYPNYGGVVNGLDQWDTSNIIDMQHCWEVSTHTNNGLASWDVSSVTNMSYFLAFAFVKGTLDISGWDVSNVVYAEWAFEAIFHDEDWDNCPDAEFYCNNLVWDSADPDYGLYGTIARAGWNTDIDGWDFSGALAPLSLLYLCADEPNTRFNNNSLYNWDMTNVWSVRQMFVDQPIFSQDLSQWDTSNISDFSGMFQAFSNNDNGFNNDSLDGWDLSSATTLSSMFAAYPGQNNGSFQRDISSWDTSNVEDFSYMFYGHTYNHDLSFLDFTSATDISRMIPYQYTGDLTSWTFPNTAGVTAERMFESMSTVPTGVTTWNTTNFNSIAYLLYNSSVTIDLSSWSVANVASMEGMLENFTGTVDLTGWTTTSLDSLDSFMKNCDSFSGDLSGWDTSNVTTLREAFYGSTYNVSINAWDVSSVETLYQTFYNSSYNQPLNSWTTSSNTTLYYTFYNSSFNQPLDNWDVSKVLTMYRAFYSSSFNSVIGNWSPIVCTNMGGMFQSSPFNQPVSGVDVSSVQNMKSMFYDNSIFNQSLNGWDTSSVSDMSFMFYNSDAFDQSLGVLDIPLVTTMASILTSSSGFSTASYDATLIGFAGQAPNIQSNVTFDTLALYTAGGAAETARTLLTGTYGWTINDGGSI